MFKKILIANRGEISIRIIRACKELGIKTVAIYSEVEKDSLHVQMADESFCVGPAQAGKSYLNIPNIISAAQISGAEAIHPGYGFLAENPKFVEICQSHGIGFIGPTIEAMKQMGDKARARKIAEENDVPVIPGSPGLENEKEALQAARKIGYPLLIKAAAGGGGRGMRMVRSKEELLRSLPVAQGEAQASFGDPKVYLERFLDEPRHVEIQVLGDTKGDLLHFGERDCSLQRRNQKILEEAPSPAVTPALREKMGKTALKICQAVQYTGAGTVEFLLDREGSFYFIEMNTRIQVEHPVTELLTGVDLVKEQIRVAAGEELTYRQSDLKCSGHAIECRLNAEDPENFSPSTGTLEYLQFPGGPGVRVDTHLVNGSRILPFYDSLMAKILLWGRNRDEALARMGRALDECKVRGVKTNLPFFKRLMTLPEFRSGEVHVAFVEKLLLKEPVAL